MRKNNFNNGTNNNSNNNELNFGGMNPFNIQNILIKLSRKRTGTK